MLLLRKDPRAVQVWWVGDSTGKLVSANSGEVLDKTVDHSCNKGVPGATFEGFGWRCDGSEVTRDLGREAYFGNDPEWKDWTNLAHEGSLFLLASDGLWDAPLYQVLISPYDKTGKSLRDLFNDGDSWYRFGFTRQGESMQGSAPAAGSVFPRVQAVIQQLRTNVVAVVESFQPHKPNTGYPWLDALVIDHAHEKRTIPESPDMQALASRWEQENFIAPLLNSADTDKGFASQMETIGSLASNAWTSFNEHPEDKVDDITAIAIRF